MIHWCWRRLELRVTLGHSNLSKLISFSAMSAYPRDSLASRHGGPGHPGLIHVVPEETQPQRVHDRRGAHAGGARPEAPRAHHGSKAPRTLQFAMHWSPHSALALLRGGLLQHGAPVAAKPAAAIPPRAAEKEKSSCKIADDSFGEILL